MTTIHDYDSRAKSLTIMKQEGKSDKENHCNCCPPNNYELLDKVQSIHSPVKTMKLCSSVPIQRSELADCVVMYATEKSSGFSGVYKCNSHLCSVCSDSRNRPNRDRLEGYISTALQNQHDVFFITLTHPRSNDLKGTHKNMSQCYKELNKALKRKGLEFHAVKSWDYTFALSKKRGQFFPHLHTIYIFKPSKGYKAIKERIGEIFKQIWGKLARNRNIETSPEAQDIQRVKTVDDIAEISKYVTKTSKVAENLSFEIVSKRKRSRANDSFTWFEMMSLIALGDERYLSMYKDFISFHKGKRTISWSNGINQYFEDLKNSCQGQNTTADMEEDKKEEESISMEISKDLLTMFSKSKTRGMALKCLQGHFTGDYSVSRVLLKVLCTKSIENRNRYRHGDHNIRDLQEIFTSWLRTMREEDKIKMSNQKEHNHG